MERYIDKDGDYLYYKYPFLENFKNFNTLLFVINTNTNNSYNAFIKTKNLIYIIIIDTNITYQEFISIEEFKYFLINNDINLLKKKYKDIFNKINNTEIDLFNIINDWLNNTELNYYKKY